MNGTNESQDAMINYNGVCYYHRDWYKREFNKARYFQQQVNTLTTDLDRYKSYVDKTNYDSEKTAIESVRKDIEINELRQQVNTLTDALDAAILEIRIWQNCYGDQVSKDVAETVVEKCRKALPYSPQSNPPRWGTSKALTLEEIKGMHGKPVWCHMPSDNPRWGIIDTEYSCVSLGAYHSLMFDYYGEWKAYKEST